LPFALAQAATQNEPQQPPRFLAGVDVVEMDVKVLDKNHQPVRGLTARDFTILEDGKTQTIVAFDERHDSAPAPSAAAWMRDVPKDVQTNDVEDKHLFVIVLDDANLTPAGAPAGGGRAGGARTTPPARPIDVYTIDTMRKAGRRAIELLGDGDLAAVVFTNDNFKGQSFTADRSKLIRAVDAVTVGPPFYLDDKDPSKTDCQPLWRTTGALRAAVEALSTAPHKAKTILYVTIGIDLPIIGPVRPAYLHCAQKAQDDALEVLRLAQLANVNVYTVMPGGLQAVVTDEDVARASFSATIGSNTGGRSVAVSPDDLSRLNSIFDESRSYYLLGYELTDRKADGRFHRVEVQIDRPNVQVVSRKVRYEATPAQRGSTATGAAAESTVGDFLPKTDVLAEAVLAPFQSPNGGTVLVSLGGRLRNPSPALAGDRIDVLIAAFSPDGRAAGTHRDLVPVNVHPVDAGASSPSDKAFELASQIDLRPGRYSVRIGLRSAGTGKTGSVYADVEVPDFVKQALSMSGILFTSSPESSRPDILSSLTATTARTFAPGGQMRAFLRVYQGGSAPVSDVSMRVRIVNEQNVAIVDRTEALPAPAFARDRQADYFVRLPLENLTAGEYWLSIEATAAKHTARRDVRFGVR